MEHKIITPEWLESKGFIRFEYGVNYDHYDDFPPSCFDVRFDENDLCYVEAELDRKQFCIVLTPDDSMRGWHTPEYGFKLYIQQNIGCGFVAIPNQFSEMTEYHFSLIYEGIRRKKL